jgi:hypothetical protein
MSDTKITLHETLLLCGFISNGHSYNFNFGDFILKAFPINTPPYGRGFMFHGLRRTERTVNEFEFFLPFVADSYEQSIALLAYYLRDNKFPVMPDWLIKGRSLVDELPWEKEHKAYRENPKACLEYQWIKPLINQLTLLVKKADDESICLLSFDGSIFKVECMNETIIVGAKGVAWNQIAKIKTKSLENLPRRISKTGYYSEIWKGSLHFAGRKYQLLND